MKITVTLNFQNLSRWINHKVIKYAKNAKYEVLKMECKLCGRTIPEEDLVSGQKYQICCECEVRMEVGE